MVIHLSNVNDNLTVFESLLTSEVMLNPIKIKLYALVMSELNGYPVGVNYHHRKCYQSFTHNSRLERLSKKSEQIQPQDQRNNDRLLTKLEETDTYIVSLETTTRSSSSSSQENLSNVLFHLLPKRMYILE